ncbi:hypothetical protein AB0C27_53880 [Nonomuraea sp. NPDC048882]|uniref:hypothetical protein n=1 Tax=Nonomuraea sp. NPDC048882 TaxID=3154347 RepID=UPI00340A7694
MGPRQAQHLPPVRARLHAPARGRWRRNLTSPYRFTDSPRPSGDEALAALTLLASLRDWLADVEPALIAAARDAGVTWDVLARVEELIGRPVTGWDQDESSRSVHGTSSWYPLHESPATAYSRHLR